MNRARGVAALWVLGTGGQDSHFFEEIPVYEKLELLQYDINPAGNEVILIFVKLLLIQTEIPIAQSSHQRLKLFELKALEKAALGGVGEAGT